MRTMSCIAVSLVATTTTAQASNPQAKANVEDFSLADLLDAQVDVASKTPQTTRETPGIVTVITRDEIISSGARDLIDVLVLVPGFAPAVDVEGAINFGIRGQWGHEGKILLLIDGQPLNELLYSTLELANHYPLEAIERIEVIRGPGSAIYGGYAELAVINILTRGPALEGVTVAGSYGQLGNGFGHADLNLTFGTAHTGIDGLAASGTVGIGHATTRGTYRDFDGNSYAMDGNSARTPMLAKLALKYRGFSLDTLVDNYVLQTRDGVGPVIPTAMNQGFRAYHVDARYTVELDKHLTLTPHLGFIRQTPWQIDDLSSGLFYSKTVTRYTAGAMLSYDPSKQINLLGGVETYLDRAHLDDPTITGLQTMFGDRTDVAYDTIATYAQGLINHDIANLTVGARFEHHSAAGSALVPRIALTKAMGRFHAKALASQAFRAPGIENINLADGTLQPEKTTVFEAELGYRLTDYMFVAVNAFDITIRKPIVYGFDQEAMTEGYQNFDRTGTRGVEAEYRIKHKQGALRLNYSFYTARGKNATEAYQVPGRDDVLLAFPAHKVAMAGSLKLYRGLSFNPSAVIYGERFAFTSGDADGNPMIGRQAPTALVNAYLLYRDVLVRGLELGAGVYDLADQKLQYLQPYDGGHAPLPGVRRELVFRIGYEHKL
ncbi:MAG: TonB-dependent receptor [Kofleriaceae bacterium]